MLVFFPFFKLRFGSRYKFYFHSSKGSNLMGIGALKLKTTQMTRVCYYLHIEDYSPTDWQYGKLQTEVLTSRMLQYGWCPSDLARTANKFKTLQALHFISMLDKRQPERSHDGCDQEYCQAYQIDEKTYGLTHVEDDCNCEYIDIDNKEVVAVLKQGDSIPLLRFVGNKDNLRIEVVKSTKNLPYVTISHVSLVRLGSKMKPNLIGLGRRTW